MATFFIDDPSADLPGTEHDVAIVTLLIGEDYVSLWERLCRPSWERYARQHRADLIVVRCQLDRSAMAAARSPAWQKLLICRQKWTHRFSRLLWLDSDILISERAQDIFSFYPDRARVFGSSSGAQLSPAGQHIYYENLYEVRIRPDWIETFIEQENRKILSTYDIDDDFCMINTGVLLFAPDVCADIFDRVYARQDRGRLYEQPELSKELLESGLFSEISARFNWGIHHTMRLLFGSGAKKDSPIFLDFVKFLVRCELDNAYFLHFYGSMNTMRLLTPADIA